MIKVYSIKLLKKLGLLDKINFSLKMKLNNGLVKIPFVSGIGLTNLVLREGWLDEMIRLFANNKEKTILDVGVNIGQTLLRVKTICPELKYIGFEPNSTCTSYVQTLIRKNNFVNCIVQNVALSTKVSNLILEKNNIVDSRASVISSLRPNFFTNEEIILAIDYSSFFPDEKIGFIKIDVEGAEYEVLRGMERSIRRYHPIIICEVLDSHSSGVFEFTQKRADLVSDLIKSLGYGIIQLQKNEKSSGLYSFRKLDTFSIKQWTEESAALNDYLFYPVLEEQLVYNKLKSICSD